MPPPPRAASVMHLDEAQPTERVMVVRVGGQGPIRHRLMDLGLVPGTVVDVVRRAPMGDPIEYRLMGFNLSLRAREAHLVEVRTIRGATVPPAPRGRNGWRGNRRRVRGWPW